MKISKVFAAIFGLLGAAICALTVLLCLTSLEKAPVLAQTPQQAMNRVDILFQAISSNDYSSASQSIYGTPDLGAEPPEEGSIHQLIWNAFVDSFQYELVGSCYATDSGIAQTVSIRYLDISSITAGIPERSRELLQQHMLEAEDMDQIYDDNNDYRQDLVDAVLFEAAQEALQAHPSYTETELTVNLAFSQGQWWVLADETLMQAISGGIIR